MRSLNTTQESPEIRESRKVATIAAALEIDESQVYRLIDEGELEAHGVGTRSVRVYLDSLEAYQAKKAIVPKSPKAPRGRPKTNPVNTAAHRRAMTYLRHHKLV
jgi:excisionase family DNA binding protein